MSLKIVGGFALGVALVAGCDDGTTAPRVVPSSQTSLGDGGIVSFDLKGGKRAAFKLINACEMLSVTANLGDTRTTITHPATTTHHRIGADARAKAGIGDGLVRIAVGLENVEDIIADLEPGLR